ncbi:MAG: Dickkopf N-terminal cysteine-rich domain-containing protein [Archangium sp.]
MRSLTLLFAASTMLLMACPAPKCGPDTCDGCCDASGTCQAGSTTAACGVGGAQCNACLGGSCNLGQCNGGSTGGGSGSTGGGTGSTLTPEEFCNDFFAGYFDLQARCGHITNEGAAEAKAAYAVQCTNISQNLVDERRGFDAVGAQACIARFTGAQCDPYLQTSCTTASRGLVANGGACLIDGECANGWCKDSQACPGTCTAFTPTGQPAVMRSGEDCERTATAVDGICTALVAGGQSCAAADAGLQERSCVDGFFCNANSLCEAPTFVGDGGVCDNQNRCALGLSCELGTCAPFVGVGETCDFSHSCKNDLECTSDATCQRPGVLGDLCGPSVRRSCNPAFYCSPSLGTCVDRGGVDGGCTDLVSSCQAGLWCTGTQSAPDGTCQSPRGLGGACDYEHFDEACAEGFYCTATPGMPTGTCEALKDGGVACVESYECRLGYACESGTCQNTSCFP